MQTTVNPRRFVAQDISLSPVSRGQSAVVLGGLRIGRVSHAVDVRGKVSWLWSLTGPHCACTPEVVETCGEAATLAEAKLQMRRAFDAWLRWALDQDGPIHWHWTEATPQRKPEEQAEGKLILAG